MQVTDFYDYFARQVQGGCGEDFTAMIDRLIDDEVITQEFFDKNEFELCAIFDSGFFTCTGCSWTLPLSDMSEASDNWMCTDCDPEEEDE